MMDSFPDYLKFSADTNTTVTEIIKWLEKNFKIKIILGNGYGNNWEDPYPWLIEKFNNPLYHRDTFDGKGFPLLNPDAVWDYLEGFYWFKNKSDLIMFKLVWGEFLNGQQ